MKPEYINRVNDNLDFIGIRVKIISDMIAGVKQAKPEEAMKYCKEIEEVIERIKSTITSRNSYQ